MKKEKKQVNNNNPNFFTFPQFSYSFVRAGSWCTEGTQFVVKILKTFIRSQKEEYHGHIH
jgi:hypothetical protein